MSNFSWRRVMGLAKKETYQIKRDPSSMVIAFVLPALLLFLFGYAVSLDIKDLKVGIVMPDASPDANLFAESFTNSPYFAVTITKSIQQSEQLMLSGKIQGIIVLPTNFNRNINANQRSTYIQVISDGGEVNTAVFLQNYVRGAWSNWLQQKSIQSGNKFNPPIQVVDRMWYNPDGNSRFFLLPGSIAIVMTLIGTLLTSLVIAREWERGTMEAMMATPVSISEILWGKIIPYYILGLGSVLLCVLISVYIFGVPLRGSLWLLFLVTALYLGTALSMGLWISTIARNQFVASQVSLYIAYLPSFLLSGFLFEISSMPEILQAITRIIPARYLVNNLQTIFLAGNVYGLIAANCFWIALIGVFLMFQVVRRVRKRLD